MEDLMVASVFPGAALYMRASTERQIYSTAHQESALKEYAKQHGFEVIAEYRDEGRSGLTLEGREGLLSLLNDIQSGQASYVTVLVYDVSRWGRFQDVDESAYYEYACRKEGISVTYCAEPFTNDGSPLATLLKGLKRVMAAEYSRELSRKVFNAHCRLTADGYKQGGTAGYGLRRQCQSNDGSIRRTLEMGERKHLPTERVGLILGPDEEVAVVRRIFEMCTNKHMTDMKIAETLNAEGLRNQNGRLWNYRTIKEILTNEKYAGNLVFNRYTRRLGSPRRANEVDKWITVKGALPSIVSMEVFDQARHVRLRRARRWTDDEIWEGLDEIVEKHGTISVDLVEESDLPLEMRYAGHFRGLVNTVAAAGLAGPSLFHSTMVRRKLLVVTKQMANEMKRCAIETSINIEKVSTLTYQINGSTVHLLCTKCRHGKRYPRWKVTLRYCPAADFVLWVRMNENNDEIAQIYLLPVQEFSTYKCLWPSTHTLHFYQRFGYASLRQLWKEKLTNNQDMKSNECANQSATGEVEAGTPTGRRK
ncbi:recombinase family protein [Massilia litorea]|uniref:Recombinase family protein n=1 Tax=Massilia litorea TaxID=2769491 RepID=A0A7L9UB18_9BURK|nr:recombinase family protein [Massilia litorea]QOL52244.1 recombinase family protein [Massilia litorea]